MTTATLQVDRRPIGPEDEAFLKGLFIESRDDLTSLPAEVREQIVDLQFRAQRAQYDGSYPDACRDILEVGGVPVGRLIVASDPREVRVVDITISAERRGEGIAGTVLGEVCGEADSRSVPVVLSVWSTNGGARRLYERLGFVVTDGARDGGYLSMCRAPAAGRTE
jgi:ribosomal protein S18 acetylase RimI-like enzyme